MKALFAPLIIPSQDALLAPVIVSPSPLVADNSESDLNEDGIVDSAADNAEGFDDNHDDDDGAVANHVDSSDAVDEHVNDPNISEERDHDQNVHYDNEATSTSSSHDLEKAAVPPHTVSSHSSTSTQQTVALALWKGHMVTHGDKDLLEAVEKHFPRTFHGVNFHNEATWEFAFNTCCRYLSKFLVASVSDLGSKEAAQLRGMLLDLEIFKFKVDWALDRLKKVEKLRFGSPFPQELADIERHRAPLLAKVEHLETELALTKEELGILNILSETKRMMLFDEFGSYGLDLLENSLGWDLLPSYQSGGS